MIDISFKPYIIRAIFEWCSDQGFVPHLAVKVSKRTRVPPEYVRNGEIVLNLSYSATRNLTIGNESIQFSARFAGVSQEIYIPIDTVVGIFAKENGKGMFFEVVENEISEDSVEVKEENSDEINNNRIKSKTHLTIVK